MAEATWKGISHVEDSLVDIRDENQGFKVLGVPMGGSVHCDVYDFTSRKHLKRPQERSANSWLTWSTR